MISSPSILWCRTIKDEKEIVLPIDPLTYYPNKIDYDFTSLYSFEISPKSIRQFKLKKDLEEIGVEL